MVALVALAITGWYLLGRDGDHSQPAALPTNATTESEDDSKRATGVAGAASSGEISAARVPGPSPPIAIPAHAIPPAFPIDAVRRGESGTVVLDVVVGIDGLPRTIGYAQRSGSEILDKAALDAVTKWRFQPAIRGGKAVEEAVEIPFDFEPAS